MWHIKQLTLLLDLSASRGLLRRYIVVNGFDGALTMLGLLSGFRMVGGVDLKIMISACVGAAVALGVSGLTSAYLSESAERQRSLSDLEGAMMTDLSDTAQGRAARLVPVLVALVNGAAPVLVSLIIIAPLWLARLGVPLPMDALSASLLSAFMCIFGLGLYLGFIGGTSWLMSGVKTLIIASATFLLILVLEA